MPKIDDLDRVEVLNFTLPVDQRITRGMAPSIAAELVSGLFNVYVRDADFIRDMEWSLVPYAVPSPCEWPAEVTPEDGYQCWRMWFARVVVV